MILDFFIIVFTAAIAFLLGSVPCGVIVSKVFYGKDVRDTGSGNIGFTNSVRSMGKVGGGVVFAGDFLKGLAAAAIGMYVAPLLFVGDIPFCASPADFLAALATFAATMGHIFCPWLGWKGGKGISTAFGASFIAMNPIAACCLFAAFLAAVIITKYVSVGSMTAAVLYSAAAALSRTDSALAIALLSITGLVVLWAHRENLARLVYGTENRVDLKRHSKKAETEAEAEGSPAEVPEVGGENAEWTEGEASESETSKDESSENETVNITYTEYKGIKAGSIKRKKPKKRKKR